MSYAVLPTLSLGEAVPRSGAQSAPATLGIRPEGARQVAVACDEDTADEFGSQEESTHDSSCFSTQRDRCHPCATASAAIALAVVAMFLFGTLGNSSKSTSNSVKLVSFVGSSASQQDSPCPANSQGVSVQSGCTCNPGFMRELSSGSAAHLHDLRCTAVPCPVGSSGLSVPAGCACPGRVGEINATASSPYYAANCPEVPCPKWSSGVTVGQGCHCNPGFNGSISLSPSSPFYAGQCDAGVLFVVKDVGESNCLTAKAQAMSEAYVIEHVACDYSADQQWYFDDTSRLRWGINGMCLARISTSDVTLFACGEGSDQQWLFESESRQLRLMQQGLCLGYTNRSRRWSNNVFLFACKGIAIHPWALHIVAKSAEQHNFWSDA